MEISSTTKRKFNHDISKVMKAKTVNCKISDFLYNFFSPLFLKLRYSKFGAGRKAEKWIVRLNFFSLFARPMGQMFTSISELTIV